MTKSHSHAIETDLVVLGAGPGGTAAAFYAADKGRQVVLVEQAERLGGVCLHRGCIPSKALLHATEPLREAEASKGRGIDLGTPKVQSQKLRAWKNSVIEKLAGGLELLRRKRNVERVIGRGHFEDSNTLRVETPEGQLFIRYKSAIIAVGSRPAMPHTFDLGNPRIMTSTEALNVEETPKELLVVGGGYIGMELGTLYASLGSQVVMVEALNTLLLGADPDLVRPVMRYAERAFKAVRLNTKVLKMATSGKKIKVAMETDGNKTEENYDRVLVSVGRAPNCDDLGLENTRVARDEKGFIQVNQRQQTADSAIYAIGDVVGGVLLAHKASKEARIAVEVIIGEASAFENIVIPAVVFADPEVAWCGLTETQAREKGIPIQVTRFPWGASGRAITLDRTDGMTKLILEPQTDRILGVGIVGVGAGELISEGVLAVEMGATAKDLAETVHPHPTLSETLMESAEAFYGTATHTFSPRAKRP